MQVQLPDDLANQLVVVALATGGDPEQIAVAAIRRELDSANKLDDVLAPAREAFLASGLSEDEAVELFEAEKHALRLERRGKAT